jgi:NMD protein affecting ribosome stability and mRNA decay
MSDRCPNCGKDGFESEKKDFECRSCGFHKPNLVELPPIQIVFCDECGNHYSDACPVHDASKQHPAKF